MGKDQKQKIFKYKFSIISHWKDQKFKIYKA